MKNAVYVYILLLLSLYSVSSIACSELTISETETVHKENFYILNSNNRYCALNYNGNLDPIAVDIQNDPNEKALPCELWNYQGTMYLKCVENLLIPTELNTIQLNRLRSLRKKNPLLAVFAGATVVEGNQKCDPKLYPVKLCSFPLLMPKAVSITTKKPDNMQIYKAELSIVSGGRYTINYDIPATTDTPISRSGTHKFNTLARPFSKECIDQLSQFKPEGESLFLITKKQVDKKQTKDICFRITKITGATENLRKNPEMNVHIMFTQEKEHLSDFTYIDDAELLTENSQHYLLYQLNGQQGRDKVCDHGSSSVKTIDDLLTRNDRALVETPCYVFDQNKKRTWHITKRTHQNIDSNIKDTPEKSFSFGSSPLIAVGGVAALAIILYYYEHIVQIISGYCSPMLTSLRMGLYKRM